MNRKYLLFEARRWLGFVIVYFALLSAVVLLFASISYVSVYGTVQPSNVDGTTINSIAIAFSVIMAMLTFSYRYDRKSSDYYLSIGEKRNRLFIARYLVSLVYLIVPYVIVSLLFYLVLYCRGAVLDYGLGFLSILFGTVIIAASYLVSCFPFSRGKTYFEGFFYFFVMMAILQLGLLPLSFFVGALAKSDAFMEVCLKAVEYAPSLLLGPALFSELFANDIADAAVTDTLLKALGESDAFLAVFSTYVATYAVLPIAATVYVYLAREPSGEKMGRPSKGPSFERYSYHFLMGTAAFILGYFCYFLVYLSILLFVVYCVVYYAVASLYARTFKVSLWDLYGYAFSLVAMASGIVLAAIYAL